MPSMTEITCACGCGRKKRVRTADIKRGWGRFYNKRCKARHQSRTGGSRNYYKSKARRADKASGFGVSEDMGWEDSPPGDI